MGMSNTRLKFINKLNMAYYIYTRPDILCFRAIKTGKRKQNIYEGFFSGRVAELKFETLLK